MGCLYKIRCPHCHNESKWNDGAGKFFDVLHCDKCGRELWTTERLLEYENVRCTCGGSFDKEVPVICPYCGQELKNPRESITDAIMWN